MGETSHVNITDGSDFEWDPSNPALADLGTLFDHTQDPCSDLWSASGGL